jgi:hypothetical protein
MTGSNPVSPPNFNERKIMYKLQETPDETIRWESGGESSPIATLADQYGGRAQICIDDHCYVLLLQHGKTHKYKVTSWWFREAVEVLQNLPLPT